MATSPELTSGKAENKYKYIQDLLEERRVLVLGYSGMGDVDIAFHLNKVKGKLYWVDRNPKGSYTGSPPNRFYVRSHLGLRLHQEDNLGNRNLLLKLASNYGWADEREGLLHPWKNGLQSWIDSIEPSQLASFIMSLHSWQTNWPSLHVAYYRYQKEDSRRARFELAEAELAVSAYFSAKRNLTTLISQSTISEVEDLNARAFLGFALWRMGRFSEALEVLKPLVLSEPQETGLIDSIQTPHFVIRHYLEVVDEMMSYEVDLTDRKQLFEAWNIEQAMYKLRSLRNLSPTDEYLRSAALLRIEYFIGNPLSNDLIKELLDECIAMEEWPSAAITLQLLLLQMQGRSLEYFRRVNRKLFERRQFKLIRKNLAYLLHALAGQKRPIVLKALTGRLIMPLGIALLEARYSVARASWNRAISKDK